jgi:ADP-heptose:LPS heptosyltransferase
VARGLAETGLRSVVTWGPVAGERECAERVVAAAAGAAQLGPRTQSLGVLMRLLGRASVFIGSDSGPMHLASLAGRPIVAIFGPTDPIENAPFPGLPVRLVRADVGCNPCREGCPTRSCMAAVGAAEVLAAARELIAGAAVSGLAG